MSKIALFISLDVLRYKVEKTLNQFGIVDIQSVGVNMLTLASRNFIYHDIQLIIVDIDSSDFDAYAVIANLKKEKKVPIFQYLFLEIKSIKDLLIDYFYSVVRTISINRSTI